MDEKTQNQQEPQQDERVEDLDVTDDDAEGVKGGAVDKARPIDKGNP